MRVRSVRAPSSQFVCGIDDEEDAQHRDAGGLRFANGESAEVLVFDLRPNELPSMPQ